MMNNQSTSTYRDTDSINVDSNMDPMQRLFGDNPTIWVFGYGSLLWKPDFPYKSKQVGYISGYQRRFYQGNVTFRGKPGKPGRVANLVESKESKAWGVAYEINGREEVAHVLKALYSREATSGGYETMVTTFHPRKTKHQAREPRTQVNKDNHLHPTLISNLGSDVDSSMLDPGTGVFLEQSYTGLKRVESDLSVESFGDSSTDDDDSDSASEDEMKTSRSTRSNSYHNTDNNHSYHLSDFRNNPENESSLLKQSGSEQLENETELTDCNALGSNSESFSNSKQPKSTDPHTDKHQTPSSAVQVLLYTATPDNDLYLGPDDLTSMAEQIVNSSGSAGSNVEYVTKIADYVRQYIPEDEDSYLFALDAKIRELVLRQHANGSIRLQLGLSDLAHDLHDVEHESIVGPVMAS